MTTFLLVAGLLIVGLVTAQVGAAVAAMLARLNREWEQREFSRLEWLERVERANQLRVSQQALGASWNGFRKFEVERKVVETDSICSFYLVPHDGKRLPRFEPGQFLTFQLALSGAPKPILRCYSLSDAPGRNYYRVSVKRVLPPPDAADAPPGLGSNYFHDQIDKGSILDVKAPAGRFVLDTSSSHPAVLVGGGVGITPLLSMINSVAQSGSDRPIWLFYGVRNGSEHLMRQHFDELERDHSNLRIVTVYSCPTEADIQAACHDEAGHIGVELLSKYLETNNYHFYVCGPPLMMKTLAPALEAWGVPKTHIFTEAFGPASVKARVESHQPADSDDGASAEPAQKIKVAFEKSGKDLAWNPQFSNLLEFASENGIDIDSSCCAGSCGTCEIAIKSGSVDYDEEPEHTAEDGCCLACVGRPTTDLVLDA